MQLHQHRWEYDKAESLKVCQEYCIPTLPFFTAQINDIFQKIEITERGKLQNLI